MNKNTNSAGLSSFWKNPLEKRLIKILDKEYPVKMSVRAITNFEKISGKSISELSSLADITIIFYCAVKSGGADLTYDQFMDLIDDDPGSMNAFKDILEGNNVNQIQ